DDRRPRLLGLRLHVGCFRPLPDDLVQLAVELVEALALGVEGEAVRLVLRLVPAGADAELGPAAGDVVDGDDALREDRGGAEGDGRDHRPEAELRRAGGEAGERRPRIEGAGGLAAGDRAVMI